MEKGDIMHYAKTGPKVAFYHEGITQNSWMGMRVEGCKPVDLLVIAAVILGLLWN